MSMKVISFTSILIIMALLPFSTFAAENHLSQAVQHAEAAVQSTDVKTIAGHVEEAKTHAEAAKAEKTLTAGIISSHLDAGIRSLNEAIKEGKLGAIDAARKSAKQAVAHLKQAA
jgi:hypothetical protein